jgi:glycosyltransferase involved in cell wall biosynthesis
MTTTTGPHEVSRRPIRVLWLVKGLGAGGAERLLVSMARVADHSRCTFTVAYLLEHKKAFRHHLEQAGVTTHCLGSRSNRDLAWVLRLRHLLRHGDYDIVHLHSPMVAAAARVIVRTLPPAKRPKIVSTEHNSWQSYLWPTRVVNAALHHLDAHRFAVSLQARDSMWQPWRRGVEVLVHGVVHDDYRTALEKRDQMRRDLGIGDDTVVVTTVANLRREKGYPELMAAAETIVASCPDVVFLSAGQGALQDALHAEHARRGLGARFRFLGQMDDIPALLAASDVFVLPSRFEGTPIAIMEALCVGLPVIATAVGGIPEEVTDGVEGILVPPGDHRALTAALRRVIEDGGLRVQMSLNATRRGQAFDIRVAMTRMQQVYDSLVTPSAGGAGKP